jgi:crossover junction endodeoxyribonuclease RuvC
MRVLGIDPGLTRCGMGVVDGDIGRPLTLVDVNVLRTSSSVPVPERLVTIEKGVDAWIEEYAPDAVAVERVFGAMVTRLLRLSAPPRPADAADALALAITHIWRGGAQARIDAALAAAGRNRR